MVGLSIVFPMEKLLISENIKLAFENKLFVAFSPKISG